MAGIYLHIPFCKQACNYCNFHFSTSLRLKNELLEALKAEIVLQKHYLDGQTIETVYFGGGTPSLLSSEEIMEIWDVIESSFPNQDLKEITLEANPDDLNKDYLKALKYTPINRLSIGIQSFHDKDLQYMNRAHNAGEAEYAVKAAQDAGLDNISIDLIYGTPTMTDKEWLQNIQTALGLNVTHISSYALTVEPKTALAHAIEKGKTKEPDNSQTAYQFEQLMQSLTTAGFEHYEISNFALPGKYAIHNTNYWKGKHYLGLGPSAHSYNNKSRQWNVANNAAYIKSILAERKIPFEIEQLSFENRFNEYVMISLRTMWGADLNYMTSHFGTDVTEEFLNNCKEFIEEGKMEIKGQNVVLTPKGKLLADGIASELFI
ncbi:radical SAM family heme chaperone HemW [Taibaiella lutea]|uniref:Heme chaperone HemW n=1 Tax=Taibaiella lutea TaxID=2608001 RepID=A0A5M6CUW1_9BACT|nr:radical SAM family heme chaperone HemW [Taibaiella lutea]KAA5536979.1 radical SAM family heme chaperone HemW [Taibaiella lutea]